MSIEDVLKKTQEEFKKIDLTSDKFVTPEPGKYDVSVLSYMIKQSQFNSLWQLSMVYMILSGKQKGSRFVHSLDLEGQFIRPIHSFLALFQDEVDITKLADLLENDNLKGKKLNITVVENAKSEKYPRIYYNYLVDGPALSLEEDVKPEKAPW